MHLDVTITVERQEGMHASRERIVEALREVLEGQSIDVEFDRADGDVSYSAYEVTNIDEA